MPLRKLEQLLAAGVYLQAKREAISLLLADDLTMQMRSKVERIACVASLHLREYYAAAKHGERAVSFAEQAGDPEVLALSHYDLGVTYVHIGDAHMAEQHLTTFLAMADAVTCGADQYVAIAHFNMSRVYRQRRNYPEALGSLALAEPLLRRIGRTDLAVQCHQDLAWCHLLQGAPDAATPHLEAIASYLARHTDDELAADLLCEQALWHRLQGDLATSSALCEEVFQPGRLGVTDHQLSEAAWILGENLLDAGRLQEAQIFANMALEHAIREGWPLGMNLACDLRRRVLEKTAAKA